MTTAPATSAALWRGSGTATQILVLTLRSLRALVLDPRLIMASLLSPLLMLLLFSQLFGGLFGGAAGTAAGAPGVRYVDFLVPAILVTTAVQAAFTTGLGLVHEMTNGIVTRFRTLPIWPGSVLLARSLADMTRTAVQLLLVLLVATLLLGFRPDGGITGVAAAWALALTVGGGLGWIFIALACWLRGPELMQSVAGLATFPLIFASTAFVPAAALPGWLRAVAHANPVTYGIEAARDLTLGRPAGAAALASVAISLTVAAVCVLLAIRGFQRIR
ncbi:ABC transporter permease [Actinomadura miaoliensis]|uniref:Transport permease protein n=1 Tax=Actinomadura miaoliensis TaxID=430685 RepID=A0ABP7WDD3_9ACTN